ncbi:hypothetical protein [Streptomyces sp. CBMA152]|uniref:hypothetical protein n=1 Tax=Streptomyces sp. CBMA152 TaxID=1896312 RepID=UPI00166148E9|nr:hypothetical protein [Streptomyces sp. CBMA152]MBD0748077.1 hypothetical protein [Streptomyces sp. CBMA152]
MSALTHHHIRYTGTAPRPLAGRLLAFVTQVARRLADSPLDQSVLHTAATHTPAPLRTGAYTSARPHAHWHTVTTPDGHRRLEAHWHHGN